MFAERGSRGGSGRTDPRRRDPEKAAERLNVDLATLEQVADVALANYNATPHTTLSGRTPLELLRYRIEQGHEIVRHVSHESLAGLGLFDRDFPVTIRASLALGHRPHVKFLHVRYACEALGERGDLGGKKAVFRVDTRDIRSGWLFLADSGACVGRLDAEPRWMLRAHGMTTRRAIFTLIRRRKLAADSRQPVTDHIDYLARRAPLDRQARNRLLRAQVEAGAEPTPRDTSSTGTRPGAERSRVPWISLDTTSYR